MLNISFYILKLIYQLLHNQARSTSRIAYIQPPKILEWKSQSLTNIYFRSAQGDASIHFYSTHNFVVFFGFSLSLIHLQQCMCCMWTLTEEPTVGPHLGTNACTACNSSSPFLGMKVMNKLKGKGVIYIHRRRNQVVFSFIDVQPQKRKVCEAGKEDKVKKLGDIDEENLEETMPVSVYARINLTYVFYANEQGREFAIMQWKRRAYRQHL